MNGNYGISYPKESDFYDVNITNSNFSILADAIDSIKSGGLKKEVVVASYNTTNKYKGVADFVCDKDNATTMIRKAIESCNNGGEIIFLDGEYIIDSTIEIDKEIRLCGYGSKTILKMGSNFTGYTMFKVRSNNVNIQDLCFYNNESLAFAHFVTIAGTSINIGNCNFYIPRNNDGDGVAVVYCESAMCRILMVGCYISRYNTSNCVIYAKNTSLKGVVMGNYCEGIVDNVEMPIKIWVVDKNSASKVKCGAQNTDMRVGNGESYNG